jgi:2-keto-4-pentenoate hydratase
MTGWSAEGAARWIAEAAETGNPLAPLPPELAPRDLREGEEVSAAVVESLGLAPCGLRLLLTLGGAIAGPMLDGRLLPNGATVALRALRNPLVTAAVVAILSEDLPESGDGPPRLAALHPALDVSATRFAEAPEDAPTLAADLARLGHVVAGKRRAPPAGPVRVTLAPKGARPRGTEADLAPLLIEAARHARRLGGLPAGTMLVVAGLTPAVPAAGMLRASLGALGAVEAAFA